ncbi:hypothetical protein GO730_00480 [Spirosoma sp. HMF3257]|uniref:hypothetical protein n=1 Tax=Spirosoma telluris TaxID=2183553 RepID=UPI0012FC6330|nr:hypothetical protein [Spirosoma telluris]
MQLKAIVILINQMEFSGLPVLVFDTGQVFFGDRLPSPTSNAGFTTEFTTGFSVGQIEIGEWPLSPLARYA